MITWDDVLDACPDDGLEQQGVLCYLEEQGCLVELFETSSCHITLPNGKEVIISISVEEVKE